MARATSSLPVPLSPVIRTGVCVSFRREIMRSTSWIFADAPTMPCSSVFRVHALAQKFVLFHQANFFRHAPQEQAHLLERKGLLM